MEADALVPYPNFRIFAALQSKGYSYSLNK